MEVPGKYVVIDGNREPKPPNVFPWGNPTQQIRAPGFPRAELFLPHEMIHSNLIPSPTFGPPRSSLPPLPLPLNPVVQNNLVTEMVRQQHEANYRRVLMSCHAALPANHLPCPNHAATSNCVHNYSHTGMNLAPFTLFPMWFSTYPRTEFMPQATKKAKESTKEETKKAESTCRMTNKVEIEGEKGIPREVKVSSSVKEISSPSAVEKEGDEETTKEGFVLLDSNAVHEES
ncbi:hypothetical protein J5N97_019929 [Dioscorea zingiberensis]|uniref:Uncharacterized protein n=1 Tax=Dioscorea zingiberensis TaxID=325984 RepID=A0A9D5HD65_9LILI|nr:hypothetical protein J5N97_019929 [Dioscorea zingiberensis]